MTNLFISIRTGAAQCGVSISEICRSAGVHRSVVERWKDAEPKNRRVADKIEAEIARRLEKMNPETVEA